MILASHGIIASQIASFDADAVAFFNRVTTAGGTLSATEKQAVNQLVLDLKANSLWTPMKAIYPMVGASAAACAQNLKSSSFTGSFTSGWTFASTGVTPNGTSAYFDTTFIPSANLSDDSTHGSLYLNTNNAPLASDPVDFGSFNGGSQALTLVQTSVSGLTVGSRNLGTNIVGTVTNRQGFVVTSKTSSTVTTIYKNGTSVISGNSGGTLPTVSSYLAALNLGTVYGPTNNKIVFHTLGDALTSTNASDFYTAVQAFQTTLSRQV
jgi:hypothetical protein